MVYALVVYASGWSLLKHSPFTFYLLPFTLDPWLFTLDLLPLTSHLSPFTFHLLTHLINQSKRQHSTSNQQAPSSNWAYTMISNWSRARGFYLGVYKASAKDVLLSASSIRKGNYKEICIGPKPRWGIRPEGEDIIARVRGDHPKEVGWLLG